MTELHDVKGKQSFGEFPNQCQWIGFVPGTNLQTPLTLLMTDALSSKDMDWTALGFDYIRTNCFIRYTWTLDAGWDGGELVSGSADTVTLPLSATSLHYGQACFEGLKAFRMADGQVRIFRPELNAERLAASCLGACMPPPPTTLFLDAIARVVKGNLDWVPPYGQSSGSMYIRPFVMGSGADIGLHPPKEFSFIVFAIPVGDYYKGGDGAKALIKYGVDRAAPNGVGHIKLAGNYAPIMAHSKYTKESGHDIMLFLDAKTGLYVEEFATSNFVALTTPDPAGKRTYVTPKSSSILPSITNRSLMELARRQFGWDVERRVISWREVMDGTFEEVAACGTAAGITRIAQIDREVLQSPPKNSLTILRNLPEKEMWMTDAELYNSSRRLYMENISFPSDKTNGFSALYRAYRAIQCGDDPDWKSYEWMWPEDGF